ncbi:MATE family efflux transporter [Anaerovoracaceae bacterium 41-7]|nr:MULTISPECIES: MATE family efflux transporter [Clostridia]MCI9477349.1 MATE family efflux transporter [Emergencia sp.]MCI9640576.1 MATE family efflux transporter [Emergencia sp.]
MQMQHLNYEEEKKQFYRKVLIIAIPVVIQHLISIGLNLVDTLMIGLVGEEALAAVGAANQVYFIFSTMCYGLYSGAAIYTAQYFGAGDIGRIRKILGMDYVVGFVIACLFTLCGFFMAPQLISIFDSSPKVVELGTQYLRIACFSYLFAALSFSINYNSRAIQDLLMPTVINGAALAINTSLNYLLIYGYMGLPQLGVKGAAIATVAARAMECTTLFTYVYTKKSHVFRAGPMELFNFRRSEFLTVMKTAVPVVVTEGGWAVSMSAIFSIYGKLGTSALAVTQVANTISEFLQSVYFGLGNATAVLVGNALGSGETDRAYNQARIAIRLTWFINIIMAVILVLARGPAAAVYQFNPETTKLLCDALLAWTIALAPKMLAYMLVCGVLRAGGDTVFCMVMDFAFNLGAQVTMAAVAVLLFQLSLPYAMLMVAIGDVLKVIWCYRRFYGKKWMRIMT